jgi:hypothetical protein
MALDLQAPNLAGLAAIAGGSHALNINPTGALGLQALQIRQAKEAQQQDNAIKMMQLQQAGQLGMGQQNIQQQQLAQQAAQNERQGLFQDKDLAYKMQQLGMQGQENQSDLAYKQQLLAQQGRLGEANIGVEKQKIFQEQRQEAMKQLLAEKKETIQAKGAYVSYGLMSLTSAKTPEEAQTISNEIFKEAVDKKYLTPEQAKQMSQLPISQRINMMKGMVMDAGMAKEYKDMQEKKESSNGGNTEVVLSDGTVIKSSAPTKPVQGEIQKKVMNSDENIRELQYMIDNVPDEFFGAPAVGQSVTYLRELGEKIPGIGKLIEPSKEAKDSNELYSSMQSQTRNLSMNVIKDLSGLSYTDKQLEFMNEIIPQIGPTATRSQFNGRAKNLLRFFDAVKDAKQELLDKGFKLDTDTNKEAFKDALLSKMKSISVAPKAEHRFTQAEIDAERERRRKK